MNNLNKNFGRLISFVCISLAALLTINKEIFLGIILFLVALFFLFISHQFPHFLSLPAKAWMGLGVMLGRFFNPITLGMLFFLLITPVGVLTRLFGRDELLLKKKNKKSYWLARQKSDEKFNSFEKQF
jgi:energy-coupling factor transporter transmembrane protein EcfT